MAFMEPQYVHTTFYDVTDSAGNTVLLAPGAVGHNPRLKDLSEYVESSPAREINPVKGHFARLSAPGYMDATDWGGPFETEKEARQYIEDTYEVDPDTGDDLPEENGHRNGKRRKGKGKRKAPRPTARKPRPKIGKAKRNGKKTETKRKPGSVLAAALRKDK